MNIFTPNSSSSHGNDEEVILASATPKKKAGRRVFKETRHPVYRGVRRRNNDKWVSEVRVPNDNKSRIWLGTYSTPEKAARAHDVAALALRGRSACLNFADSAWRFPLPPSTDPDQIRRVAAEAADHEEATNNNNNAMQVEAEAEAEAEETISWELMVDEPLRSPQPPAHYWDHDVDEVDAEVSLWSFGF